MQKDRFPLVSYAIHGSAPLLSGLMLDNGVALLAAHLHASGFEPTIFDYNTVRTGERIAKVGKKKFLEETVDALDAFIAENDVKNIGFKLYMNGFVDSVGIASQLRERKPHIRIFAGGPQVGWFGESIFNYANEVYSRDVFDALLAGEGDHSIIAMANGSAVAEIPGVLYRDSSGKIRRNKRDEVKDLDAMPLPIYDKARYVGFDEKIHIPVLEDSRNCDYRKCAFCIHPRLGGMFRERSVKSLVAESEHNLREYGLGVFRLGGPDPVPSLVTEFARKMPDSCRFSAFGRADGEGYDLALLAKKMVGGIFIGLESADPAILLDLRKTDDPAEYLRRAEVMIRSFRESGLPSVASCIVPSANETSESMGRTLDFLIKARPDFVPVMPLCPMPGTPLIKRDESQGIRCEEHYDMKLMRYELDLLRPSSEWPDPPFSLKVNGEFVRNPFKVTAGFVEELNKNGFSQLSDEIVLMADIYYGKLSADQDERRKECMLFSKTARDAIARAEWGTIHSIVERINANVASEQYTKNG